MTSSSESLVTIKCLFIGAYVWRVSSDSHCRMWRVKCYCRSRQRLTIRKHYDDDTRNVRIANRLHLSLTYWLIHHLESRFRSLSVDIWLNRLDGIWHGSVTRDSIWKRLEAEVAQLRTHRRDFQRLKVAFEFVQLSRTWINSRSFKVNIPKEEFILSISKMLLSLMCRAFLHALRQAALKITTPSKWCFNFRSSISSLFTLIEAASLLSVKLRACNKHSNEQVPLSFNLNFGATWNCNYHIFGSFHKISGSLIAN